LGAIRVGRLGTSYGTLSPAVLEEGKSGGELFKNVKEVVV